MAVDITALPCCLGDFWKVFADWEAHQLIPSAQTRKRPGKLSRAEMLFIMVPQGNRTSEQGEQAGETGIVPFGPLKLAAQRLL
jgi:hypothetical protein